ncbi:MAG TPA: SDR family NAD(P)-dependent oxidoreductase [Pyrinomonadaceae bacterium]|nr:SDR family NAD(P)-dependent oxidoreductase [Pyrinomonadaceae bacterium]
MFWKDKTVLLTGASSGIGEGIALAIAKQGARLGLLARREDMLTRLADECKGLGSDAIALPADVTDPKAMENAAARLRETFGHIDILIANAGIGGNNPETRDLEPEAVSQVIDINLLGAAYSVHAVLPQMLERGQGQLVAISSLAGFRGLPKSAAYSASKAGMTAFFESVRLDVTDKGIDVTIIQPGFIKTPLTAGRQNKMPFLMELHDAVPLFLRAIERKKKFAAFPWQLASFVRLGKIMPTFLYDRIAGRAKYRT